MVTDAASTGRACAGSARLGGCAGDRARRRGHGRLRQRAVGDVLAGEGLLVHRVRMSPGSTQYHRRAGRSAREHVGQLLEGGLRRAVAAPPLVASTAASEVTSTMVPPERASSGRASCTRARGATRLTRTTSSRASSGKVGGAAAGDGPRALALFTSRSRRAPAAVDQAAASLGAIGGGRRPSPRTGPTVVRRPSSRRGRLASRVGAAGVDDQAPAAGGQGTGERQAEAARGAGDDRCGCHGPKVRSAAPAGYRE